MWKSEAADGERVTLGRYVMMTCKCPSCGANHGHPIRRDTPVRIDKHGSALQHRVECNQCLKKRVSPEQFARYMVTHERMVKACEC